MDGLNAEAIIGISNTHRDSKEREGFGNTPRPEGSNLTDWDAFIEAYYSINATKFLDDDRQDYFISVQSRNEVQPS